MQAVALICLRQSITSHDVVFIKLFAVTMRLAVVGGEKPKRQKES